MKIKGIHKLEMHMINNMSSSEINGIEIFIRHERGETYSAISKDYHICAGYCQSLGKLGLLKIRRLDVRRKALEKIGAQ